MNVDLRVTCRHLGLVMAVLSAWLLAVAVFALCDRLVSGVTDVSDVKAFLAAGGGGIILAGALVFAGRKSSGVLGQREALVVVTLTWLGGAALSGLPFRLWAALRPDAAPAPHSFDRFADCYFEAMSGLTGTGATVVQALAGLPRSMLLWRALTHWLGGLGIIVLFVAIFPMLGVGARRIYRLETPGPTKDGVAPRIQDTARALWIIYSGLTLLEIIALRVWGMNWFDAVCHTMATVATGGFGTQDANIAAYPSTAIHLVIVFFLILSGTNYGLYYQIWHGQWRKALKDPELRLYLAIIAAGTAIVAASLLYRPPAAYRDHAGEATPYGTILRDALFQVVSIQTTTGFTSADFDTWGFVAKATLLTLMFIGASSGSTSCGLKVVRVLIAAKVVWNELEHLYRPRVVRTVKLGKTIVEPDLKLSTLIYVITLAVLFGLGTAGIMVCDAQNGVDITTAASASATTLNGVGPGLARVGATQNYAWMSAGSKIIMSILMVLGRLEVFTVLVLFSPRFWRGQ